MAKRRGRMEQRIVDLAIMLESLLTPGERPEQLSLTVRTRGAWLLGTTYEERRKVHDLIQAIYKTRSEIVHGGKIKDLKIKLGGQQMHVHHIILDATRLCESAVNKMIKASTDPDDWTSIVLGQAEDQNE